jgi:hypothetical protein
MMRDKEEINFRKEVIKALRDNRITGYEAKALIRNGLIKYPIFVFEDDMTEEDHMIRNAMEKMGYCTGILTEGTGKGFLEVEE